MPPDAPGGFPPPQGPPQRPPQPPPARAPGPPQYKVYRSRRGLLDRLRSDRPDRPGRPLRRRRRRPGVRPPGAPDGKPLWRRVLRYALVGAAAWLLLSFAIFMISAQTQEGVSNRAENALSGGGSLITGSTVLVLGSDQRPKGTKEPGARGAPSRADSIMLLHVGIGSVRKLSILRDSFAGEDVGRINAAYANGGAANMIRVVERFMGNGLEVNHVIEVDFSNFPELIDALGGVDITLDNCLKSDRFGDKRVKLSKGEHHLSGREALRFARVRKNRCAPNEDDRARARRQQQVLKGMRDRLVHPKNWPSSFIRAPWIAWEAPRALRTDMKGPGMLGLFTDLLTGGSGETEVLDFEGVNGDGSLRISREARAEAVERLTEG